MHQPYAKPRRSIYYQYQVHQPWLASQHPGEQNHPVVIVGTGPVGLTTALEMARHGQRCVVLESELQVSEGSRAIVFTRRSMEILQQVGVAHRVTETGLPWCYGNSIYRGQRVYRMENARADDDRFFPMINLQQQFLEEYLVEAVEANPLIELRWGNRINKVEQRGEQAFVEVDTPEGPYPLRADWLVACDGARSGIRTAMNLLMEGASYEGRFVIADIRIDLPLPTERLAFFDPTWNPGNTILMHREPHGIWRVDYQLPAGEDPEDALKPESLKARIDAQLEMIGFGGTPWEMDWSSVYSARALTLPNYVHGRVIFAGDAAHMLPIFGVRGANTGFQDAQALGWRLALVAKGAASPKLLDSYSSERVGAAREIVEEAGKSTRFMAPPTRGFRLLRDAVLSLSLSQPFVGPLYHWRTSRPHEYAQSPLNSVGDDNLLFKAGPAHGAPPVNVRFTPDSYLLDQLGGGFDLLYFTDGPTIPAELRAVIDGVKARHIGVRLIAVTSHSVAAVDGADVVLDDSEGRCRARYGVMANGAAYLLRPDQHICARWMALDANRLQAAFKAALPV
ncbi:FAD-dependent monooxygenase [Comamonas sp. 26]|uniref:FAD-dependent monooxygenase n=1 Tax=Comamonas sp. 26 TaxID=2035201 RepID=UPI000C19BB7A|nr:FAD-dependent monooxygenase [Comamonas sp. 26]PIG08850.1 3-(3-hydroxy-phenyl)propionate hydroxylase [Comamonas sp. 26]